MGNRRRLDEALLRGAALVEVARKYNVSADALGRHLKNHVHTALQRHAEASREAVVYGSKLSQQLAFISSKAEEILQAAQQAGQLGTALRALQELRESARLLAISMGELESEGHKTQIAIQVNSEKVDRLVDEETQIRIAMSYLERHAPHLLAPPPDEPGSEPYPCAANHVQGNSVIHEDNCE